MNKKQDILNAIMLKGHFSNKLTNWAESMFFNFIGGEYFSYPKNENKYKEQFRLIDELFCLANIGKNKQAYKKALTYVISNFCDAVALEFDCSYGYAQKVIVKAFGKSSLESINNDLISQFIEYNSEGSTACDIALNNHEIKIK